MELFGSYTSPYVRHCRILLLETGLDCVFTEIDHSISAAQSPTKRMPFLRDGAVTLTDSSSIVKYLRNKAGQAFFEDAVAYDRFCMVNTALDTTVNLFMLEKDGVTPEKSSYLMRQSQRLVSTLEELNKQPLPTQGPYTDTDLRLACYLGWALFRKRVDLKLYPNLEIFLQAANDYEYFRVTAPR
jgi:glutathione S-transferase